MAVLQECPICRNKQSLKNKKCNCGYALDKGKRTGKIKYWIQNRLPTGKQRKECIGYSINDARVADGKRKVQKKEGRIFDMLPEASTTMDEIGNWYLSLRNVKSLKTYQDVISVVNIFNNYHGRLKAVDLKQTTIEDYQGIREDQGKAPATIDKEIRMIKTMVTKAFHNDKIDGRVLKAFANIKKKLRKGANARKRTLSMAEFGGLLDHAPSEFYPVIKLALYTGMRAGEIRALEWSMYDKYAHVFRLPWNITKEKKDKIIPIIPQAQEVLFTIPQCVHHDNIFTSALNEPFHKWAFTKLMKETCHKAEIPYGQKKKRGLTFHDIRRTVKTNMLEAGIDKSYRDLILGHSLQGMDIHYISPDEERLIEEMGKYSKWLSNKIPSDTQTIGAQYAP